MELQQYIIEIENQILKDYPKEIFLLQLQTKATKLGLDDKSYADFLTQLYFDLIPWRTKT